MTVKSIPSRSQTHFLGAQSTSIHDGPHTLNTLSVGLSHPWLDVHGKLTLTSKLMHPTVQFQNATLHLDAVETSQIFGQPVNSFPESQKPLASYIIREEHSIYCHWTQSRCCNIIRIAAPGRQLNGNRSANTKKFTSPPSGDHPLRAFQLSRAERINT